MYIVFCFNYSNMPPRRNKKNKRGRRARKVLPVKAGHPPAPAQETQRPHDLVLQVILNNLSPNVRKSLTVRQIIQLIATCQVRLKRCPVTIDISSEGENLIGVAVEKKSANQYTCKRCNETFSWRPNEDYLSVSKMPKVKGNRQAPRFPELKFKMNCNCNNV